MDSKKLIIGNGPQGKEYHTMILGIAGRAGAGKTTIAWEIGDKIISFAEELKDIASKLGVTGKSTKARIFYQTLGAAARKYDPDVWVKTTIKRHAEDILNAMVNESRILVFDDVRYENEVSFIKQLGGYVVMLTGRSIDVPDHESEQLVLEPCIKNTGSVKEAAMEILRRICHEKSGDA